MTLVLIVGIVHTWTYNPHVLKHIAGADIKKHLSLRSIPAAVSKLRMNHLIHKLATHKLATIQVDEEQFDTQDIQQHDVDQLLVDPPTRWKSFDIQHGVGAAATVLVHLAAFVSKKHLAAVYSQAEVNALLARPGPTNRAQFDAKYGKGAAEGLLHPQARVSYRKILMDAKKKKLKHLRKHQRMHFREHQDMHRAHTRRADQHRDELVSMQKQEMAAKHKEMVAAVNEMEATEHAAMMHPRVVLEEDTVLADPKAHEDDMVTSDIKRADADYKEMHKPPVEEAVTTTDKVEKAHPAATAAEDEKAAVAAPKEGVQKGPSEGLAA